MLLRTILTEVFVSELSSEKLKVDSQQLSRAPDYRHSCILGRYALLGSYAVQLSQQLCSFWNLLNNKNNKFDMTLLRHIPRITFSNIFLF